MFKNNYMCPSPTPNAQNTHQKLGVTFWYLERN